MCGICGIYGLHDKEIIQRMCKTLAYRGPDNEGYFYDSNLMLAMRRLSVIDIETGKQPLYNEDKSIILVYNGEIYNYRELTKELKEKGHIFTTNSDTETIIHLYEEYGEGLLKHLRGMFAFALWDLKRQQLFIARDRIGIKPLYYCYNSKIFAFASEIKSLLVHPDIGRELNYKGLHDYLTFMYVPAPNTIFKDIYKLLPGHFLIYENGNITIRQYWDLDNDDIILKDISKYDENDLLEKLSNLIEESIKIHLVSDVPLGVFLSGGTDSGSIVAMLSEITDTPIKSFSIGFEDNYLNELDNARLVAKRYKTDHHEFIIKPQNIDFIQDIISYFDEPFADSSAIPTYYVSKYAKQEVTVALSGDGGDEAFGGYGNYKADKIILYYNSLPSFLREKAIPFFTDKLKHSSENLSFNYRLKKLIAMSRLSPELGHVFWLSIFDRELKDRLYKDIMLRTLLNNDTLNRYHDYFSRFNKKDFINQCICVDIKTVLPDDYLKKVDMMSMLNSLEVRVPFLDHKLLEFAVNIPSKFKLKGLTTKYLLKKIMKKKLPNEILEGKKKGFSIPLSKWFRDDFSALIENYLSENLIRKRGYFDYKLISLMIKEHMTKVKDNSKFLWTLICFEIWHQKYLN
ncbi:asparagine synthase, glutamine-hydrolyzing [Candidatus Magnetobacterium bavaricum]|uniref:asparagine synthase (glutamine-hydrolyzing) n=1 Tax=Candidatus Magnetobacterium bavaricum TaxID=29290 RepID=A0A0F3GY53_9BACT|nr:asparagine synthase, glutamine-hydrolyzing [Candidatus Magnetobacterium bavaricum]